MNRVQKQISAFFVKLAKKEGKQITVVDVPEARNSPGMAQNINKLAGEQVCHYSLLFGLIIADKPEKVKPAVSNHWCSDSTNLKILEA